MSQALHRAADRAMGRAAGNGRETGQAGTLLLVILALILAVTVTAGVVPRLMAATDSLKDANHDLRARWTVRSALAYALALYENGALGGATQVSLPEQLNGLDGTVTIQYLDVPQASVATIRLVQPHSQGQPHQNRVTLPCDVGGQVNLEARDPDGNLVHVPLESVIWRPNGTPLMPDSNGFWRSPGSPATVSQLYAWGYQAGGQVVEFDHTNSNTVEVTTTDNCGFGDKAPHASTGVSLLPHQGVLAVGQSQHVYAIFVDSNPRPGQPEVVAVTPQNGTLTVTQNPGLVKVTAHTDHWELAALAPGTVAVEVTYTGQGSGNKKATASFEFFTPAGAGGSGRALFTGHSGGVTIQMEVWLDENTNQAQVLKAEYVD